MMVTIVAILQMDEVFKPLLSNPTPSPPTETLRLGVGGSTQSLLQGLNSALMFSLILVSKVYLLQVVPDLSVCMLLSPLTLIFCTGNCIMCFSAHFFPIP